MPKTKRNFLRTGSAKETTKDITSEDLNGHRGSQSKLPEVDLLAHHSAIFLCSNVLGHRAQHIPVVLSGGHLILYLNIEDIAV